MQNHHRELIAQLKDNHKNVQEMYSTSNKERTVQSILINIEKPDYGEKEPWGWLERVRGYWQHRHPQASVRPAGDCGGLSCRLSVSGVRRIRGEGFSGRRRVKTVVQAWSQGTW